ncbi:TonB-linked outer membrane protein, SusC/RagA family [Flavobacterium fluvii]|uniref:TonB-linked outer membrane protein, SusC/RagA family n=1 Tax=Flavobacterium fluvii TaxID=468056 RepID=A0A1M5HEX8_9FLAO|nr:TonB-dependent receptor [Flavobacterium fluvii]SHG14503.1 TonB-linked outer membrane protein, SusC/RagA family [Flavobacterium fluvii]
MKNLNLKYQPLSKVFRHLLVGIFMIMAPGFVQAQSRTISGSVHDDKKEPLPGVTVSVKGTNVAALTDGNGQFNIKADSKDQLVFTYISYESATVTVGDKSSINVTLKSATSALDEVVVIGYGTMKRKDLTGSVGSVSMADINKAPIRSFDDALAGRVAGVQVTSSDGRPGSGVDIVIRGNNSLTQANSPLYVIDGFLIEDPNNNVINPADIESIDILKDASATAIYGARGANGVIVIQTKRGKQGKPVFTFNSTTGVQSSTSRIEVLSPYDYVSYQIEYDPTPVAPVNQPKSPTELYLTGPGRTLDYYKTVSPIDWQDLITRTALYKNNDFAVRGGTEKFKYAASVSATDQDGIVVNSNYKRYQGRLNLDYNITDKLKVGINTNYSFLKQTGLDPTKGDFAGATTSNVFASVWGSRPVPSDDVDLTDAFSDPSITNASDYRMNPIINLENTYEVTETKNFGFNGYLEYLLAKNLKLRSTFGINENRSEKDAFYNTKTSRGRVGSVNGVNGSISNTNYSNWLNENTITWDKTYGKSKITALGGFTAQQRKDWFNGYAETQLKDESLMFDGMGVGLGVPAIVVPTNSKWTMASFLARVNYNYGSKYMITASMRADGSSKFPSQNHWGYFPSGAVAWKFKEENFLKNNKTFSDGKLRASYGQTGNNRVGAYDYLTTYLNTIGSTYSFQDQYNEGVIPNKLGNSDLKWETTEQIDAGIDLGFLNQRITFAADVYKKTTNDLLLRAQIPNSSGFTTAFKNIGSVENKGLELTLNTKNIVTKDFTWTTSANIAFNKNKLLKLNEGQNFMESPVTSYDANTSAYIAKVGEPIGQMYGLEFLGTYKNEDFNTSVNGSGATVYTLKPEIAGNGNVRANIRPGDVKYKDQDGNLNIDKADYTVIGNGAPKHTGGFNNNFTYKNFDLNIFFQWSYGNDVLNVNRAAFDIAGVGAAKNLFEANVVDRWTTTNPNSDIPRVRGFVGSAGGYSSYIVEDGSYLRFKTLALGYNVDQKLVTKWHLKSMRFFVSGQNLYTWTKYTGPDPEVNTNSTALTPGFDYSPYPRARTIAFGTNITF